VVCGLRFSVLFLNYVVYIYIYMYIIFNDDVWLQFEAKCDGCCRCCYSANNAVAVTLKVFMMMPMMIL